MNKHELRSAYDKLALSARFKAETHEKLTQGFGKLQETIPAEIEGEQEMKAFSLSQPQNPKWGAAVGIAAAAVVALGIWGAVSLSDRDASQLNPQTDEAGASSISETHESSEEWHYKFETWEYTYPIRETKETNVSEDSDETPYMMDTYMHYFPSYHTNRTEYNADILDIIPFDMTIDLPSDWSLTEPDTAIGGFAPMYVINGEGETVAVIDYNIYEKSFQAYGQPNYYRAVYNQLMLGSMVSWDFEYTPVVQTEHSQNATCQIMHHDPTTNETTYSDGILAYSDDLLCYVNISFNVDISDELQRNIAKSIKLSRKYDQIADHLSNMWCQNRVQAEKPLKGTICVNTVTYNGGAAVILSSPVADSEGCSVMLFQYSGSKYHGFWVCSELFDYYSIDDHGGAGWITFYSENSQTEPRELILNGKLKIPEATLLPLDSFETVSTEPDEWEKQMKVLITESFERTQQLELQGATAPTLYSYIDDTKYSFTLGSNTWANPEMTGEGAMFYYEQGLIADEIPFSVKETEVLLPEGAKIIDARLFGTDGVEYVLITDDNTVELLDLPVPSVLTLTVKFTNGTAQYHILRECDPSKTDAALAEPPQLCIEANGELYLTSMGRSEWTYNGMTTSASTYDGNPIVIPDSQWIDSVRVIIPEIEGAKIQSVTQHLDGYGSGPCLVTNDVIDFPDGGRLGNRYTITMEYPQGVCEYHFATEDVLTEPPHGYIQYQSGENTGEVMMMYKADYSWEYDNRGELTKHEGFDCGYPIDPYMLYEYGGAKPYTVSSYSDAIAIAQFSGGEIVSVTAYTPDGVSDELKFDKENGRISLPSDSAFKIFIVRIAYDTEDYRGRCNYYFFIE